MTTAQAIDWHRDIYDVLRAQDISLIAHVPDAGHTPLIHRCEADNAMDVVTLTTEEEGVAIEYLRKQHGISRVAYVDIDAHHGDGVFYSFMEDPDLIFVDFHEDGRYLYPGTGDITENGEGEAAGTKLNIPMPPRASDDLFMKVWPRAEAFIRNGEPEFVLIQCGADSIGGDPITHMAYTESVHEYAVRRLCGIADEYCEGRVVAMGGGGYNLDNIAKTWTAVVGAMISAG